MQICKNAAASSWLQQLSDICCAPCVLSALPGQGLVLQVCLLVSAGASHHSKGLPMALQVQEQ